MDALTSEVPSTSSVAHHATGSSTISAANESIPERGKSNSSSSLMSRMVLNDNKAGMEGLDKEKINQIIYEASKGSKFYENERKKEEQLNLRIKEQQFQMDKLTPGKLQEGIRESTSNYIARRFGVRAAMPGFIGLKLCPDLVMVKPNFTKYTAVSHLIREIFATYDPNFCPMSLDEAYLDFTSHLDWRITSSAIDRTFLLRPRSVLDASNIESSADSACVCDLNKVLRPLLVSSDELQERTLSDFSVSTVIEKLCQNSERFKICPECQKSFPSFKAKVYGVSTEDAVLEMRNRIEQRTLLTASAGIAPNTMLAKVCSDRNKPNGQFRIQPSREEVTNFVESLPIRKISGVGKVTEKLLGALGVSICSDLHLQRGVLYHLFSPTSFRYFMRISLGLGSTLIERDGERKSMSTERTFNELNQPEELYEKCRELSRALAEDLQEDRLVGKTVTLKIKTVAFEVKTRSHTLQYDTNDENKIFQAAKQLLKTEMKAEAPQPLRLRLMGVRMSKLSSDSGRCTLTSMFQRQMEKNSVTGTAPAKVDVEDKPSDRLDLTGLAGTSDVVEGDFHCIESTGDDDCAITSSDCDMQNVEKWDQNDNGCSEFDVKRLLEAKRHTAKKGSQGKGKQTVSILNFVRKADEKQTPKVCDESEDSSCSLFENSKSEAVVVIDGEYEEAVPERGDILFAKVPSEAVPEFTNEEPDLVRCPICCQQKRNWPLDLFNDHVDLCLNKQTIKDILQDQESQMASTSSSTPSDLNMTTNRKRQKQDVQLPSQKKGVKRSKGQSSLLSFFK
ncbi:DNA polymerase kappa isoform X2 [Aplysia californica]|uniref:DNA polymerase kappa n=1 Tax=Aplysia californica TaxID=6500 RepID=A0ABM1VW30_APLCA|nr:DNA polymerase kappa isoform X2 [Aplysia californica]